MKFLIVFFTLLFCGSAFSATLNHQPKITLDVDEKMGNSNVLYKEGLWKRWQDRNSWIN